jgi:Na+/H+-dicarboxylate symporter
LTQRDIRAEVLQRQEIQLSLISPFSAAISQSSFYHFQITLCINLQSLDTRKEVFASPFHCTMQSSTETILTQINSTLGIVLFSIFFGISLAQKAYDYKEKRQVI